MEKPNKCRGQKKRRGQRRLVRQVAKTLITAERKAKNKEDDDPGVVTHEDMEAVERKGLIDEANIEIFLTWWGFGGAQHGISPMQAAEMPMSMRQDFNYILEEVNRERRRQERLDNAKKGTVDK